MNILFFGDSISSGKNDVFENYVNYLQPKLKNSPDEDLNIFDFNQNNTTIGEYSIYPIENASLISKLYQNTENITTANIIFLEYGMNDASAFVTHYVDTPKIIIDFIKCIKYIRNINSNCKIIFLALDNVWIRKFSKLQIEYLKNSYFEKIFPLPFIFVDDVQWIMCYNHIYSVAKKLCDNTFDIIAQDFFVDRFLDSKELHPNTAGYQRIADNLQKFIDKL